MKLAKFIATSVAMVFALGIFVAPQAFAAKTVWEDGDANLKLDGFYRFRLENDSADNQDKDRSKLRIVLKMGGMYTANETVSYGFRLASCSSCLKSPHQTLGFGGGAGTNESFGLEQAYMKLNFGGPFAILGKMPAPVWAPEAFVWNTNINPEGMALGFMGPMGDMNVWAGIGYFIFNEGDWGDDDTAIAYQAGIQTGESLKIKAAIGGFTINDADEDTDMDNMIPGGSTNYMNVVLQVQMADSDLKPTITVIYGTGNSDDDKIGTAGVESADKTGMVVSGKVSIAGLGLKVAYWDVGANSMPANSFGGQVNFPYTSNMTGIQVVVSKKLFGAVSANLKYYTQSTKNKNLEGAGSWNMSGDNTHNRIQLDLNIGF